MLDLKAPGMLALAAEQIHTQIDDAGELPARYAWRIKPSSLGGECVARIWYSWRWATHHITPGRVARTFDRGNEAEARMCAYIRKAKWSIMDVDPDRLHLPKKQYKAKALQGHLVNFLDGICYHEEHTGNLFWLLELKTMSKGRFSQLVAKKDLKKQEQIYYTQIQVEMHLFKLPYCLWVCECTDDQEICVLVIPYNEADALRALELGEIVKTSVIRPARVAETPAFGMCKKCEHRGPCHLGEKVDRNCRSCVHVQAIDDGQFWCTGWNLKIPGEAEILMACPNYEGVK